MGDDGVKVVLQFYLAVEVEENHVIAHGIYVYYVGSYYMREPCKKSWLSYLASG
jgi:hypothetical protein